MTDVVFEVAGLSYRYPDETLALDEVRVTIHEHEVVALIGPNGAGKSTLLLHLCGLLPSRAVSVYGLPARRRDLVSIRAQVGMVFQRADDQLFMPTVGEDVAFGPVQQGLAPDAVTARVEEALALVGMAGSAARPPYRLSAGEQRAVAVATVLATRPRALVCDEPTADLDPRARRAFIELMAHLPGPKVVATHDLDLAHDLATRVVILDRGRVVADGLPGALLGDEDLLRRHGLEQPPALVVAAARQRIAALERRLGGSALERQPDTDDER